MEILLSTTRGGRYDPGDKKLLDLVDKDNYKQALADVEKRLKKGRTDTLLVNKAILLYKNGDWKRAYDVLPDVVQHDAAFKDKEILVQLDHFAHANQCPPELRKQISALWDKALKTMAEDEDSCKELFETKFISRDYALAQKIALLRRDKSRDWRLRWIVSSHLISHSLLSYDSTKPFAGKLACKFIGVDAQNAIDDPAYVNKMASMSMESEGGPLVPKRVNVLNGPRELELLLELLRRHDMASEATNYFDKLRHTIMSGVSYGLIKQQMEMLKTAGKWADLWNEGERYLSQGNLQDGKTVRAADIESFKAYSDDWMMWKLMVEAIFNLPQEQRVDKQRKLLELLTSVIPDEKSRLSRLLKIHIATQDPQLEDSEHIAELCVDYFKAFSQYATCFRDLKGAIIFLPPSPQSKFLRAAREHSHNLSREVGKKDGSRKAWLQSEINMLKQDYYRVISIGSATKNCQLLNNFASTCLRLYKASLIASRDFESEFKSGPGERRSGDDALMLAVMALIHVWNTDRSTQVALFRITLILETLLTHSPHNYEARLFAIRVYLFLGITDRAIHIYEKLDVKNLQQLSTAWILISRLSTVNPTGVYDILHSTYNGVKGILSSCTKVTRAFLKESSWVPLLQQLDCFETADQSIAAWIAWAELAQASSLLGKSTPLARSRHLPFDSMQDFRENTAFANFEGTTNCSQLLVQMGPTLGKEWVVAQLQAADLRVLFAGLGHEHSICHSNELWSFDMLSRQVQEQSELSKAEGDRMLTFIATKRLFDTYIGTSSKLLTHEMLTGMKNTLQSLLDAVLDALRHYCSAAQSRNEAWKQMPSHANAFTINWESYHEINILFDCVSLTKAFLNSLKIHQQVRGMWIGSNGKATDKTWFLDAHENFKKEANKSLKQVAELERLHIELLKEGHIVDAFVNIAFQAFKDDEDRELIETLEDGGDYFGGRTFREHCLELLAGWRQSLSSIPKIAERCI